MKWHEIRCKFQKKIGTEPTFTSECWIAAGEIRSRNEGLQDACELFRFLHSVHLSKISHLGAVQCVGKLHKRFPDYFTSALADEIISFQMLYLAVNTSSTANSSPIKYLQFSVNNELSDSFPQFEVLIRLFITLPINWNR